MARPMKDGLDYFPLDVHVFEDEIVVAISGEFEVKGELAVIKLLCAVYQKGYYIVWNELMQAKIAKQIQGTVGLTNQIVNRLVQWGFFDKSLFDSAKVLTSVGIQERYAEATKRRKNQDIKKLSYWINADINDNSNGVNVDINAQSKLKETTLNKSNEESNSPAEAEQHESESFNYAGVIQYLNDQSGKHFKNTATNRKLIKSRLDEGFDRHDVRMAIDHVVQAWKDDPEMERYIQPSTIFRASKFEGYVNSVPGGKQSKGQVRESTPDWAKDGYQHEHKPVDQDTVDEVKAQVARLKQEQAQEA